MKLTGTPKRQYAGKGQVQPVNAQGSMLPPSAEDMEQAVEDRLSTVMMLEQECQQIGGNFLNCMATNCKIRGVNRGERENEEKVKEPT